MASFSAIHDPLAINLRGQTRVLLSSLPPDSSHAPALIDAASKPTNQLAVVLSGLLCSPDLTILIATLYRPLLLQLCARWLDEPQNTEAQLVALCYLLEVHEELFPCVFVSVLLFSVIFISNFEQHTAQPPAEAGFRGRASGVRFSRRFTAIH
jgi:midasin